MNPRTAGRVAWLLFLAAVVCAAGALVLEQRNAAAAGLPRVHVVESLWPLSWAGFPIVGALIVSRRPRNLVGWILVAIGAGMGFDLLVTGYARYALVTDPGSLPFGRLAGWFASWTLVPVLGLVPFLVVVFPSGRIASRAWRVAATVAAGVLAALMLWQAIAPVSVAGGAAGAPQFTNPFGLPALAGAADTVTLLLGTLIAAFGVAAVCHAVWRLRRGPQEERQQLKSFVCAAALFPVLFWLGVLVEPRLSRPAADALTVAVFVFCFNAMAAAIGVAVFKHRLYEIDRIISRTFSYALLTAVLAALYAVGVVVLGQLLRPLVADTQLAVAGSTLAVAAAFGPVRRRVQAAVDRRFNRARYDAVRTVEAFRGRLRDKLDLDELSDDLLTVVNRTVEPARVDLWLRGGSPR